MQGTQSRASFLVYKPQLVSATLQDACADSSRYKQAALVVAALPGVAAASHEIWLKARPEACNYIVVFTMILGIAPGSVTTVITMFILTLQLLVHTMGVL